MSHTRRDFIKTAGAAGIIVAGSDLIADLLAQTPPGKRAGLEVQGAVRHRAEGSEDRRLQLCRHPLHALDQQRRQRHRRQPACRAMTRTIRSAGGGGRGGGGRGGGGFGGGGGGGRGGGRAAAAARGVGAAGFGVRVIHSGTWGFASSPIVTEDEIRRITQASRREVAARQRHREEDRRQARAGPGLPGLLATTVGQRTPTTIPRETKQDFVQKVVDAVVKNKGVQNVNVSVNLSYEWKYFASSEGSYIEQESWFTNPSFSVTARKDDVVRTRTFSAVPEGGRLGSRRRREDARERRAHRRRSGRVHHRQADRHGRQGSHPDAVARDAHDPRDRRARDRARSHHGLRGQLRRHELREDLRHRQAEVRLEAVQRHRRQDDPRRPRHGRATTTTA